MEERLRFVAGFLDGEAMTRSAGSSASNITVATKPGHPQQNGRHERRSLRPILVRRSVDQFMDPLALGGRQIAARRARRGDMHAGPKFGGSAMRGRNTAPRAIMAPSVPLRLASFC
jgi:hypothetical protein